MISDRLREQQISPRNEYNFSKASPSGVPRSTKGSASFSSSSTGGASLGGSPTQSRPGWLRPGPRARSKILSSYVLLSTGNALVAGLRQRSKIYGPASLPPLVLAAGARGPGGPSPGPARAGVVVRCVVNGLLSTHKSPYFVLASLFCLFQFYIP